MNNQINIWATNQLVTQGQMNDFSENIYFANGFISDAYLLQSGGNGAIINLASITQGSGSVTLGNGSFRFPDSTFSYLPYNPPLVGNAAGTTLTVSGNGYIVAQYTISPQTSGSYEYVIECSYAFVTSLTPPANYGYCLIVGITAGVINNQWGTFANTAMMNCNPITNTITLNHGATINCGFNTSLYINAPNSISNTVEGITYGTQLLMQSDNISGVTGLTELRSYLLANNNIQAIHKTNFVTSGSSIYPTLNSIAVLDTNNYAQFHVNINSQNTDSLYSAHTNVHSLSVLGAQEFYLNSDGLMTGTLYATSDSPTDNTLSGITVIATHRPRLFGNNLAGLASTDPATILIKSDIVETYESQPTYNVSTVQFPLTTTQIHAGFGDIAAGATEAEVVFTTSPFQNNLISIVITLITGSPTYKYSVIATSTNIFNVYIDSPAPTGGLQFYYMAFGN